MLTIHVKNSTAVNYKIHKGLKNSALKTGWLNILSSIPCRARRPNNSEYFIHIALNVMFSQEDSTNFSRIIPRRQLAVRKFSKPDIYLFIKVSGLELVSI